MCDNTSTSPYYGNCYVEWDLYENGDELQLSTSIDGGMTWSAAVPSGSGSDGTGGQPLAQPNGTVVVPILTSGLSAFTSTNGGASWSAPVTISNLQWHKDDGGIRSLPLPSAAQDGAGKVYVVWEDCRFRSRCSTNDLVYSTSTNGTTWSAVTRIPIDATTSTVDHFIPGIGIDPTTSGATAHVAVTYYYYPKSSCTKSTCQLYVGYISSANGGSTWNTPVSLAGPMQLGWLPNSDNGLMVADYIATAFTNGVPYGVFAVAAANSGTTFNEAIYTAQGLPAPVKAGPQLSSAGDKPLHHLSDKVEREKPERGIPPSRRTRNSK
ncbi:MAG: sialidase family protein [Candidatus Sulfotelmatobacter sp.]